MLRRALLLAALSGASACKTGRSYVHVHEQYDPDASTSDAGKLHGDGGAADAAMGGSGESGGGGHAQGGMSGSGGDGNNGESGTSAWLGDVDAGDAHDCEVAASIAEWSDSAAFRDEGGFAIDLGLTGFGVAYRAASCSVLGTLPVSAVGAYRTPQLLFGDCANATDVSLLHLSGGYRVVWIDNSTDSAELQSLLLSEALTPSAELQRTRVTDNQLRELRPAQANFGTTAYLSWISVDAADKRAIQLQRFEDGAQADTVVAFEDGYRPTSLALAQLGKDHGAIGFTDEDGKPGLWLLPIDNTGQHASAVLLSDAVTAGNTLDLATRTEDGGAAIYSVDVEGTNHEVRFRRLDPQGSLLGQEIKIVGSPVQGRDASITRLGDGYVVAYRQLPEAGATRGEVRLALITKEGNPMKDSFGRLVTYHVTDAAPSGGRITARVSVDGQLLVGFLDADDSGPKFRLIRKRLDCAL